MRGTSTVFCLLSGIALFVGCGAGKLSSESEAPRGAAPKSAANEARWVFQPLEKEPTVDQVEFEGGLVEVDGAGSRWWNLPGQEPKVSPFGAPEPLAAVLTAGKRLFVIGESGAVYITEHALSPFVEARTPPERYLMTRRSGSTLIAIAEDGSLRRSDNLGRSWSRVALDGHFADLATAGDGTILALSVPEQWYQSTDGGRTFSLLEIESQGPRSITGLVSGELLVSGLYQTSVFRGGRFEPASRELLQRQAERAGAKYSLPQFALASAVKTGRAGLDAGSYLALRPGTAGQAWHLARGPLDGPLSKTPVKGLEGCGAFRFAAAYGHTAVICQSESGDVSPRLTILRGLASSNEFQPLKTAFRGQLDRLKLVLSPSGKLAVTDLCPRSEKGCDPLGVTVISKKGEVTASFLPGVPRPTAVAFDSLDRLWFSGHRAKDGHFVAYLESRDAGSGRLVDLSRDSGFPTILGEDTQTPLQILPGESGDVSVTALVSARAFVGHLNHEAEVNAFGVSPPFASAIHGAGQRLAVLQVDEGVLWESLTGGLSWSQSPLPRDLCGGSAGQCEPALVCSKVGCLVGDELARVGWGQADDGRLPTLPAEGGGESGAAELAGFECQVDDSEWRDLDGLLEIPGASNSALGNSAWSAVLKYPETAALTALSVDFDKREIVREVLLAPVSGAQAYAFHVSPQVEGVAAVRYRVPQVSLGSQVPTLGAIHAEVVWDSRVADVYGSGAVDIPAQANGAFFAGFGMFRSGEPELLSVAGRGIYFRMGSEEQGSPTYFIRGRGKLAQVETVAEVLYPPGDSTLGGWASDPEVQASVGKEFVQVKDQHAGLLSFANRRVMTLALGLDATGSASVYRPYLLGIPRGDATGLAQNVHYAYLGDDLGFVSLQVNLSGPGHRAAFVGLDEKSGFTAPIAVPLQQDLESRIVPCSAEQRNTTPRVVAPLVLGAFRRIEVRGAAAQPIELRSMNAVLHGTPTHPCVAVFDTRDERRGDLQSDRYAALVFPGGTSWIFRTEMRAGGLSTTSVRPMNCQNDGPEP